MKRLFTIIFISLQFSFLFAENWRLSIEPLFGMKYGEINEYVFMKKSSYPDDKLSELNWDIKPELYAGLKSDFGYKALSAQAKFSFGIPMQTGKIFDSDWFNVSRKNTSSYQYKTHFSESDNYLKHDFSFGLTLGYLFSLFSGEKIAFSLKPGLAFDYENIYFNGRNGYARYGKLSDGYYKKYDSEEEVTYDFSGKDLVDYNREKYIAWLNLALNLEFFERFSVDAAFGISPLSYTESIDVHYINADGQGTAYLDAALGFFKIFQGIISSSYKINSRNSIMLSASCFYMSLFRGDNYSKSYESYKESGMFDSENEKSQVVDGGASEYYWDFSLGWKFRFF